jgi:hypothetical protein
MRAGRKKVTISGTQTRPLKGVYAFGGTAYTPPGLPNGPPQVFAGIRVYDGNGHFTQRDLPQRPTRVRAAGARKGDLYCQFGLHGQR